MLPDANDHLLHYHLLLLLLWVLPALPLSSGALTKKEGARDSQLIQSNQDVDTGIFPFFFLLFKHIFFQLCIL